MRDGNPRFAVVRRRVCGNRHLDEFSPAHIEADDRMAEGFADRSAAAQFVFIKSDDPGGWIRGEEDARYHGAFGHFHLHAPMRALRAGIDFRAQLGRGERLGWSGDDGAAGSAHRHPASRFNAHVLGNAIPDIADRAYADYAQSDDDGDDNQDDFDRAAA